MEKVDYLLRFGLPKATGVILVINIKTESTEKQ